MATKHGYAVPDLSAYLTGRWRLEREILDVSGSRLGGVIGVAEIVDHGERLDYTEQGELVLADHRGPARRRLGYRLTGPGRAEVHFDHGGFFHEVDLRDGRWSTRHLCGDDDYQGGYHVVDADRWRQTWRVTGPRKAHVLVTEFRRLR
ncbi:hypothetical protein FHR81_001798 [Actinoalloteichus hoggarensis]|uniref:Uncharacterized protein n=1 Tax=Actinoalloteichus hoggarensis TaxID=1470176 RepID=A0A221W4L5_9PSEU|nr:DUF6314 family protein [Actinoalloteichus hoggarensis]ASO20830.1 hypothetical protein AHOG_16020 [Actinoalloteichus hoggarensis]MBB5920760.1 hypothetical protein [Actinoalloteichus hoggarensis]